MIKILIFLMSFMVIAGYADANMIKVLIIDDVFVNVPEQDEHMERMGNIHGDLLVNGNHYLGDIEVWKGRTGLYLVNKLPLEEYIKNVVSVEVGMDWHTEALKAQAVIVRTYALYKMLHNTNTTYDLTSSVLHQFYKTTSINPRLSHAVNSTQGEVVTYRGNIIESLYHSTCGGRTENPEEVFSRKLPYLTSVESNCEISPYWVWERRIPVEEIEKKLSVSGITEMSIASYTSTHRVKSVKITHQKGTETVLAADLRRMLGWKRLPSTNFTLIPENGAIIFEGKGYGHGVGLCQWCSLQMARDGMNYKEILLYFYPGTAIQIYENR